VSPRAPLRCAAFALATLLLPAPSAGAEPAAPAPADPVARGVAFLVGAQNADGTWGSFESRRTGEIYLGTVASHIAFGEATSALATMALLVPARTDAAARAALARGAEALLRAPVTRRATGSTFYNTWAHVYRIQALARLAREPGPDGARFREALGREIAALESLQGMDGGWGYYDFGWALPTPSGHESTSFLTAAALVALHEAAAAGVPVAPAVIERALRAIERLRLPDGAYVYGVYARMNPEMLYNRVKGSLGRSQPCNLALWLHRRAGFGATDLLRGLENLKEHHHFIAIGRGRPYPHEAWYYTAGYYFFFGHYYAALVIRELDPAAQERFRPWLRDTLAGLQDADGSWWDFPFYGYHKAYGTALALLALEAL